MASLFFDINNPVEIKIQGLNVGEAWSLRLIDANFMLSAYNGIATSSEDVIINVIWKNVNLQSYGYVELVVNGKHCHSTNVKYVGGEFLPFEEEDKPTPTIEKDGELCVTPNKVMLGKDVLSFKLTIISFCSNDYIDYKTAWDTIEGDGTVDLLDDKNGGFYLLHAPSVKSKYRLTIDGGCSTKSQCLTEDNEPKLDCDCSKKIVEVSYDPSETIDTDCALFASNHSTTLSIKISGSSEDIELTNGSWAVYSVEGTLELATTKVKKNDKYYLSVAINSCEGGKSVVTIKPKDDKCQDMLKLTVSADDSCITDNFSFCVQTAYTQSSCCTVQTDYGECAHWYTYHVTNNQTGEDFTDININHTLGDRYWKKEWDSQYVVSSATTESGETIYTYAPLYTIHGNIYDGSVPTIDEYTQKPRQHMAVGKTPYKWLFYAYASGITSYDDDGNFSEIKTDTKYEKITVDKSICAEANPQGVGSIDCMNYDYKYTPSDGEQTMSACPYNENNECFFKMVSAQTYFVSSSINKKKGQTQISSSKQSWSLVSNDPLMKYTIYGFDATTNQIVELEKFNGDACLVYTNTINGLEVKDFVITFEKHECFAQLPSLPVYYIVPNEKAYKTLATDYKGTVVFVQDESLLELDFHIQHYKYCVTEEDKEFALLDNDGDEICPKGDKYEVDLFFLCDGSIVNPISGDTNELKTAFENLKTLEDDVDAYTEALQEIINSHDITEPSSIQSFKIKSLWGSEYVEYFANSEASWINTTPNENTVDISVSYNKGENGREDSITLIQQYSNASYIQLEKDSCEPVLRDGKYIYVDGWRSETEVTERVNKELTINVYQCKCPPPDCKIDFDDNEELFVNGENMGKFIFDTLEDAVNYSLNNYKDDDYEDDTVEYMKNVLDSNGYNEDEYSYFVILPKFANGYGTFTITSQTAFDAFYDLSWLDVSATTVSEDFDYEYTFTLEFNENKEGINLGELAWQSTNYEDCSEVFKILFIQNVTVEKESDPLYIEYALISFEPIVIQYVCTFYGCDGQEIVDTEKVLANTTLTQEQIQKANNSVKTIAGQTFNGWNESTVQVITANTSFHANCSMKNVRYEFWDANNNVLVNGTVVYGSTIPNDDVVLATNKVKETLAEGSEFEGWDKDTTMQLTADTTVFKPQISSVSVEYSFVYNDNLLLSGSVPYGSNMSDKANEAQEIMKQYMVEGEVFDKWTPSVNTPITANTVYTGSVTTNKIHYTFIYDVYTISEGDVAYGTVMTAKANEAQSLIELDEGEVFDKWTPDVNVGITADTVYTAQTALKQVHYTFINCDDTIISEGDVDYGTDMTPYATEAQKSVVNFEKWDKVITTAITSDTDYQASCSAETCDITDIYAEPIS